MNSFARSIFGSVFCLFACSVPAAALAQSEEGLLIKPTIPFSYDKGRNISVTERERPDYDAVGIRMRSFNVYPRVEVGGGYDSNIYLTSSGEQDSAFALVAPSLRISSDWSRHALTLRGGGQFYRYFGNSRRNENNWNFNLNGRTDISKNYSLYLDGEVAKVQEQPFDSGTDVDLAGISQYRRNNAAIRAEYKKDRFRVVVGGAYTSLRFDSLDVGAGPSLGQANRNRDTGIASVQGEYAISPSLSVYMRADYSNIDYTSAAVPVSARRDSNGWRGLAGVNMDISGFFRGSIGIGYSERDFNSALFRDVSGLSAEAKLEYFPSELTTFTLGASRLVEDASLGNIGASFNNRAGLRVDHELLRNMIVNAHIDFGLQDYVASPQRIRTWRLGTGAQYLASPAFRLLGDATYGQRRTTNSVLSAGNRNDLRFQLSLVVQR